MASPDHPSYISMPAYTLPLRSAMKGSNSRPGTPGSLTPGSPPYRYASTSHLASASMSPSRSMSHTPASFASSNRSPSVSRSPNASLSVLPPVAALGYTPKVGFDTFEDPQASMFSFTLHVQSDGYERNKNTRVYLCAASPDESGTQALDWALESLVQEGDELVVFRGVDADDPSKSLPSGCMGRT